MIPSIPWIPMVKAESQQPRQRERRERPRRHSRTRTRTLALAAIIALLSIAVLSSALGLSPPPAQLDTSRSVPRRSLLEEVLTANPGNEDQICRPTGQIADACCDFETVEKSLNTPRFFDTLNELVKTNYFRYYKVDLYKDCPFWVDNGLCMNRACTVEKASEDEIPREYRAAALSDVAPADQSEVIFHSDHARGKTTNDSCHCRSSDFCHWEDEETSEDAAWVDLIKNPERFTGYAGPGANRVWKAIYEENCFGAVPKGSFLEPPRAKSSGGGTGFASSSSSSSSSNPLFAAGGAGSSSSPFASLVASVQAPAPDPAATEQCLEKRVFYRVISGLHASISTHICAEYLDTATGQWTPNLDCFISRISQHPERLQNVYFNYVLLVRALARAGEYLHAFNLKRGHKIPTSEQRTVALLESLVSQATSNPPTFNEASMFHPSNPEAKQLRLEFKNHFRNISSIMDCVGCDKCRLWGKMQVNGLGTAMKILFSDESDGGDTDGQQLDLLRPATPFDPERNPAPVLERSELVALINTLHRFAESLKAVETFREMYQKQRRDGARDSADNSNAAADPAAAAASQSKAAQKPPQPPPPSQPPPPRSARSNATPPLPDASRQRTDPSPRSSTSTSTSTPTPLVSRLHAALQSHYHRAVESLSALRLKAKSILAALTQRSAQSEQPSRSEL